MAEEDEPLIRKHGGYRRLKSFQIARLVYDLTVEVLRRIYREAQPYLGPDGSGGTLGQAEHP